ncbi:MAG: type IV pilus modification protein PilV [Candidatus Nitrotoga sp.]|nr:type IV pilus modification protein PilV [Candidatus Nitrotoga sp.]MDO9446410.1 type IV pilus modification protein PilV [Candidatus Nitrotoga sp.]
MCVTSRYGNTGFSLIEVLVTIVILMIGLLGLAGLQGRALTSQLESYQRSQALILVRDMENRINANRKNAASYVTEPGTALGWKSGTTCAPAASSIVGVDKDKDEWSKALLGCADGNVQSGVPAAGTMIGARGCVYQIAPPASGVASTYLAVVAWQGLNNTKAPDAPAGDCGKNLYGSESLHRVVTLPISIADLN